MSAHHPQVLIITPFFNFRDEELIVPLREFSLADLSVTLSSSQIGIAQGSQGHKVQIPNTFFSMESKDFDAIVLIGGKGTPQLRSNEHILPFFKKAANESDKIFAAICWAPTTFALAGLLKNKKATVWSGEDSEFSCKTEQVLSNHGAIYLNEDLVIDGRIITANGAHAAQAFARAIVEKIKKK